MLLAKECVGSSRELKIFLHQKTTAFYSIAFGSQYGSLLWGGSLLLLSDSLQIIFIEVLSVVLAHSPSSPPISFEKGRFW